MPLEVAPGYKKVVIAGAPLTIGGNQIYYHAGRGEYSIERDHSYLVDLEAKQAEMLDVVLQAMGEG